MATTNNNTEYKPDCDPVHIARRMDSFESSLALNESSDYSGEATTFIPYTILIPWEICKEPNKAYYFSNEYGVCGYLLWVQYDLVQMIQKTGKTASGDLLVNQWIYCPINRNSVQTTYACPYISTKSLTGFSYAGSVSNATAYLEKDFFYIEGIPLHGSDSARIPYHTAPWRFSQGSWFSVSSPNTLQAMYSSSGPQCLFVCNYVAARDQYQFGYYSKNGSRDYAMDRGTGKAIFISTHELTFNFKTSCTTLSVSPNSNAQGEYTYNPSVLTLSSSNNNILFFKTQVFTSGGYCDIKKNDVDFDVGISSRIHPYVLANV